MKIAFFDSGVGGVTVLAEAVKLLPKADYIYYADTLHVPYGPKPKADVKSYIAEAAAYLAGCGIDALVVACNTATSVAIQTLRQTYAFPVIGMEPAVKPAVANSGGGRRVLVLATALTLQETKFRDLVSQVDHEHVVDSLPMPELVEFAEKLIVDEAAVVPCLQQKFAGLDLAAYGTVVLGCTHFAFFRGSLRRVLAPGTDIIDGTEGTLRHLLHKLEETGLAPGGDGGICFFASGGEADAARLQQAFRIARGLAD
ncbi:MAG: glutamate racemase [Sporomusaceae bacterium]|nr:glutamate racemase [Sporomusaceae bacterium]